MLAKVSDKMDEIDIAKAALNNGDSIIMTGKLSSIFYMIKKYGATVIPAICVLIPCIIVMALTKPKTNREFIVALLSTFACAIFGPSVVILVFGIDLTTISAMDQENVRSLMTIACGLPGWVFVRACFNWTEANRTKTIVDLIKQIKSLWS